ncbi:hypothetical protein [Micromonospora parva]|uniref:hypothetical protein n=1 Tax=Micromonospora parva TaxID=1464048 RepID=UPI00340048A7
MTMTVPAALEQYYRRLEARFLVTESGNYSALVTPNGNHLEPVHRWFHFKEAFSHRLLERVLKDEQARNATRALRLYDPFTGSGTSAVSAGQLVQSGAIDKAYFHGAECNPFLHLLSSAKLAALQSPPSDFLTFAGGIAAVAVKAGSSALDVPALSTFHNSDYFQQAHVQRLMALRNAFKREAAVAEPTTRLLAASCLASSVEPASNLRRDGRTLRYSPAKVPADPVVSFLASAERIQEDLSRVPTSIQGGVTLTDVRENLEATPERMDVALFSPPYPNNIDYTEVYKLELWALGLINSDSEFAAQRRRSLRSHGSLRWQDEYSYMHGPHASEVEKLLQPVLDAIPNNDRYTNARRQLVMGYADDMLQVVSKVARSLRPGGLMACVVGNSLHGKPSHQLLIAADLIIAALAELAGMEVTRIEVARRPVRRRTPSDFLRESVVFARVRS